MKRYKGGEANDSIDAGKYSPDLIMEEPEEQSSLLHRGSKFVKDADVLRFSKASSLD